MGSQNNNCNKDEVTVDGFLPSLSYTNKEEIVGKPVVDQNGNVIGEIESIIMIEGCPQVRMKLRAQIPIKSIQTSFSVGGQL
jgi:hypothetical protein